MHLASSICKGETRDGGAACKQRKLGGERGGSAACKSGGERGGGAACRQCMPWGVEGQGSSIKTICTKAAVKHGIKADKG